MDVYLFALGFESLRAWGPFNFRAWGLGGLRACGFEGFRAWDHMTQYWNIGVALSANNDILFFIYFQVSAAGQCAQGSGPNKKLAKRAAAEALLQLMGYSRPSLQPSKPALKTSHSNGSTASTTSSSSMSCSSLTNGEIKEKTKKVRSHFYYF